MILVIIHIHSQQSFNTIIKQYVVSTYFNHRSHSDTFQKKSCDLLFRPRRFHRCMSLLNNGPQLIRAWEPMEPPVQAYSNSLEYFIWYGSFVEITNNPQIFNWKVLYTLSIGIRVMSIHKGVLSGCKFNHQQIKQHSTLIMPTWKFAKNLELRPLN